MSATAVARPGPSVDYINPFVGGVVNTWKTMLNCTPARGKLMLDAKHEHGHEITAIVALSGPASGIVALRFNEETAAAVTARMLNETTLPPEAVVDAISELVNIVGGSAKAQFSSTPPITLGLPTVIRGDGYRVEMKSGTHWLTVPFTSELGPFALEVAFEPPQGSK